MLLSFKVKNYKSFLNEVEFSMVPAPKQKDLEYSILYQTINGYDYKALPTSVIYGPNASGKTNVIGAFQTFIKIIDRGNIRNDNEFDYNLAMNRLELIPNKSLKEVEPVCFSIEFLTNEKHIKYELKIELGLFLDVDYERKVIFERLTVNNKIEYVRKENEIVINDEMFLYSKELLDNIMKNLEKDTLFLNNAFRNSLNKTLANEIIYYLKDKFTVIYRSESMRIGMKLEKDKPILLSEELSTVAKRIGACGDKVFFVSHENDDEADLGIGISGEKNVILPIEFVESYGTVRLLNMFPMIKTALTDGGTIIIDEFDASLHPMVIMHIINLFHNDEINKKNAQLIFNTHNPIFLSNTLFRRDEIKFIEKENDSSIIYSLSDFGTAGEKGVRKTDDYMKNYFINKYGAIEDINLADLFEKGT